MVECTRLIGSARLQGSDFGRTLAVHLHEDILLSRDLVYPSDEM